MKFKKEEFSTFKYWLAHWCTVQWISLVCRVWKPRYLLHDIEKPFLMWLWKDGRRVQRFHEAHSRHHIGYKGKHEIDWEALVIDWESARYTKEFSPLTAKETAEKFKESGYISEIQYGVIMQTIKEIALD